MNRLLTLASGSVFATALAILPISAFAQQNDTTANGGAKPAAPLTQQPSGSDAKAPAPVKPAHSDRQMTTAKHENLHKVKPVTTPGAGAAAPTSAATPMGTGNTSAQPPSTPATVQPKVGDQSKF